MCFKPILEREHDGQTNQDFLTDVSITARFPIKAALCACYCLSSTLFLVLGLKTPFYFNHLLLSADE